MAVVILAAVSCSGVRRNTVELTLAGNSVARDVYEKGLIPAFEADYAKRHPGHRVRFVESYDSSGAQTRAILSGLEADVAALSLEPEMDKLSDAGLASKEWSAGQNRGVPATSVVVMIVRRGNPKGIRDWSDLTRPDVDVILPNPDTSGAAQWNVAAIAASSSGTGDLQMLRRVRGRVKVFGRSGKEAMQIFASGVGDVLVGWECEALDRVAAGDAVEVVYPQTTLQMEPPVAVITPKGRQTKTAAEEFVAFLDTSVAQRIYAAHHYRPRDPQVMKDVERSFHPVGKLLTIEQLGGWPVVRKRLFGNEGIWAKAGE